MNGPKLVAISPSTTMWRWRLYRSLESYKPQTNLVNKDDELSHLLTGLYPRRCRLGAPTLPADALPRWSGTGEQDSLWRDLTAGDPSLGHGLQGHRYFRLWQCESGSVTGRDSSRYCVNLLSLFIYD